jgi:sensor domain CHASE-containing protein
LKFSSSIYDFYLTREIYIYIKFINEIAMKLRIKTITVLGSALTCLILLLYGLSSTIFINGYKQIEHKEVIEDLNRTDQMLTNEMSYLSSTTRDYSGWDDTYEFVQGNNPDYVDVNLVDATFVSLRLNIMVFLNSSNEIVFKKAVDLEKGNETVFPQSFLDLLKTGSPLIQHSSLEYNLTGIVQIPEGPLLVSSYPVLRSDRTGPIQGTLIFGQKLDTLEIRHLSEITQLDLTIYSINGSQLPSDIEYVNSSISKDSRTFVKTLSENKIAGYIVFNDVQGHKSLIIKISVDRDIYQQGKSTMNYFIIAMTIICIFIGVLLIVLMEMFVLRRLRHLSSSVDSLGSGNSTSSPLDVDGKDEFATFAKTLRGKLESLNIIPVQESNINKEELNASGVAFKFPVLHTGRIYFVDEPKPDIIFKVFYSALANGSQGLCLTRIAPKKVREAANLEKTPIVWLSTTAIAEEKTIDPSSIARINSTVQEFLNTAKQPVILIEGLEYLIFVNNFRFVLTMLHSIYEKTITSKGIILLSLSKPAMTPPDWVLLTKDMEEIGPTPSKDLPPG